MGSQYQPGGGVALSYLPPRFALEKLLPLAPDGGEIACRDIMDWMDEKRPGIEMTLVGVSDG